MERGTEGNQGRKEGVRDEEGTRSEQRSNRRMDRSIDGRNIPYNLKYGFQSRDPDPEGSQNPAFKTRN